MFLCHNEQACVLSQLCKIGGGWRARSDHLAKGPLQNSSHYLLPTQTSPAASALEKSVLGVLGDCHWCYRRDWLGTFSLHSDLSTLLQDAVGASGKLSQLSPWTDSLPTCTGSSYPEYSARAGGTCIICYLWLAQCTLSSWVNPPAWRPTGGAGLW